MRIVAILPDLKSKCLRVLLVLFMENGGRGGDFDWGVKGRAVLDEVFLRVGDHFQISEVFRLEGSQVFLFLKFANLFVGSF